MFVVLATKLRTAISRNVILPGESASLRDMLPTDEESGTLLVKNPLTSVSFPNFECHSSEDDTDDLYFSSTDEDEIKFSQSLTMPRNLGGNSDRSCWTRCCQSEDRKGVYSALNTYGGSSLKRRGQRDQGKKISAQLVFIFSLFDFKR